MNTIRRMIAYIRLPEAGKKAKRAREVAYCIDNLIEIKRLKDDGWLYKTAQCRAAAAHHRLYMLIIQVNDNIDNTDDESGWAKIGLTMWLSVCVLALATYCEIRYPHIVLPDEPTTSA